MKQTMGSTWSIQAVIFFILIFATFLSLIIQYSKAYRVKNESINIFEKYEGLTKDSKNILEQYLTAQGYLTKGTCIDDGSWYGIENFGSKPEKANKKKDYLYCVKENRVKTSNKYTDEKNDSIFYNVLFFYKFNLPVIGEIGTYRIMGRTHTFVGANNRLIK